MSSILSFTADEIALLARTADALCAYLGKPVVAEVIAETEAGYEWAVFAIPLDPRDADEDLAHVQVGGPRSRVLGSQGGLNFGSGHAIDCRFLWAIQLSDQEGSHYIKVDPQGEEVAWSDALIDLLPFALDEEPQADLGLPEDDPE